MKKIFLALSILFSSFSFAQQNSEGKILNRFEAENKAGGKIVLTTLDCFRSGKKYPLFNEVYSFSSSGNTTRGCWILRDDRVVVIWDGGTEFIFDPEIFTPFFE